MQEDTEDAHVVLAALEAAIACLHILGAPGMPQQVRLLICSAQRAQRAAIGQDA